MIIQLRPPLDISIPKLVNAIPYAQLRIFNSMKPRNLILDHDGKILFVFTKQTNKGFERLETNLDLDELDKLVHMLPPDLEEKLVLALARAKVILPQFYRLLSEQIPVSLKTDSGITKISEDSLLSFEPEAEAKQEVGEKNSIFSSLSVFKSLNQKVSILIKGCDLSVKITPHLSINLYALSRYIPNTVVHNYYLLDITTLKPILKFKENSHKKYSRLEVYIPLITFAEYIAELPFFLSDPLVLALGKLNIQLFNFFEACIRNHDTVSALNSLKTHINPNDHTSGNIPYLFYAIQNGSLEIVEALIRHKAEIDHQFHQDTPLLFAIKLRQFDIAKFIASKTLLDKKALIYAAGYPEENFLNFLLDKKASVHACDASENGINALFTAVYQGHHQIVKILLDHDAYPSLLGMGNKTELYWASKKGYSSIIKLLMERYSFFYETQEIHAAIAVALKYNHPSTLAALLSYTHIKKLKLADGEDLLSYAVDKNYLGCVVVLLKRGFTDSANVLLNKALQEGYFEVAKALSGGESNFPLLKVYRQLTLSEVRDNPDFIALFENERKLRLEKQEPQIILAEPWGTLAAEYALLIKSNAWIALNFSEPDFLRNIYKAFRQTSITLNETVLAYYLHKAVDLYQKETVCILRQHSFDGKGPYHPEDIIYASSRALAHFQFNLQQLPENEQCYFSINCPRLFEFSFLYSLLDIKGYNKSPFCQKLLSAAVRKMPLNLKEKEGITKAILSKDNVEPQFTKQLKDLIKASYPELALIFQELKRSHNTLYFSAHFLARVVATASQQPSITLSLDYDERNPKSPLLSRIIMSIGAFNALQEAMHGVHDTVDPFFTVGIFSPHLIKELLLSPEHFGSQRYRRPAEIRHPDIPGSENPHNYHHVHDYEKDEHDRFHAWRCGSNVLKPFIIYLERLEESITGFKLSKSRWRRLDMDFSMGDLARIYYKGQFPWDGSWSSSSGVRQLLFSKTAEITLNLSDETLIYFIDMLQHKALWKKLTLGSPKKHFENPFDMEPCFTELRQIIDIYQNASTLFYIVAYRLRLRLQNHFSYYPQEAYPILSKLFHNPELLNNLFVWTRNSGVQTKPSCFPEEKPFALHASPPKKIIDFCNRYFLKYNTQPLKESPPKIYGIGMRQLLFTQPRESLRPSNQEAIPFAHGFSVF